MPAFKNRTDAGNQLAEALRPLVDSEKGLVIALPRGGVVVGHVVANALKLPLDVVCPRKIGAPFHPEYAIGAVTESGTVLMNPSYQAQLLPHIEAQQKEAERRAALYRGGRPLLSVQGKQVLLIDDGIATGLTMQAAVAMLQEQKPAELILAVPAAPPGTLAKFKERVVCLVIDENFRAVSQYYEQFDQVDDATVIRLIKSAQTNA